MVRVTISNIYDGVTHATCKILITKYCARDRFPPPLHRNLTGTFKDAASGYAHSRFH